MSSSLKQEGSGMDFRDVQAEVERIKTIARDDEHAHSAEKELWEKVLETMAEWDGCEIAREALKTRDIEFSRWFA